MKKDNIKNDNSGFAIRSFRFANLHHNYPFSPEMYDKSYNDI